MSVHTDLFSFFQTIRRDHFCTGRLIVEDDPVSRLLGYHCERCGCLFQLSLYALRSGSEHPYAKAMGLPKFRQYLADEFLLIGIPIKHDDDQEWVDFRNRYQLTRSNGEF